MVAYRTRLVEPRRALGTAAASYVSLPQGSMQLIGCKYAGLNRVLVSVTPFVMLSLAVQ